jgi:hypothetical protein
MRDPERIQRIIEKLSTIWAMDKDCRFGQLVYAIFWQMPQTKIVDEQVNEGKYIYHKYGIDPFNIEDDDFEAFLDRMIEKRKLVISQRKM